MAYSNLRNYLHEKSTRLINEWRNFQKFDEDPSLVQQHVQHADYKRIYIGSRNKLTEKEKHQALQSELDKIKQARLEKNLEKDEPFEYYRFLYEHEVIPSRLPKSGVRQLHIKYHTGRITTADHKVPVTGYPLHPRMYNVLVRKYPQYLDIPNEYCRPLGTSDATFSDFNKEQIDSRQVPAYRNKRILQHVVRLLGAKKFLPLHFTDTLYAGLPLNTGTGYHNRHSFKINAHAKYSAPEEYANKPTSKGYYINAFLESARTIVHYIKYTGLPYDLKDLDVNNPDDEAQISLLLEKFFNEYPTQLFTRSHISKRVGPLKARPVYAVDELFLTMEVMLTFCLHVQARKMDSAIMYSLETIRGGNAYLDKIAQNYQSYFTIDWSSFDQTIPRKVTDIFFEQFLPSLLVVNKGYHPTYEFPTHTSLDHEYFPYMMENMINFLHTWFNNMTFVTSEGYAYKRTVAGLPSGLLNTQYLDSFCNLYVMIDSLIEFGLSDEEISQLRIFVMGDDNSAFTPWPINKTEEFIDFIAVYAKERWNMNLSRTKCIVTDQRHKIETLSYQCNFGRPKRDPRKLVAQLCYPEHGVKEKYMSARAIGMAYAACGSDPTFHSLCQDVYNEFLSEAADLTDELRDKFRKYLPGQFNVLDDPTFFLRDMTFPTIMEIQSHVYTWRGELPDSPKWNRAHFINDAFYCPNGSQTLLEHLEQRPPKTDKCFNNTST